MVAARIIRHQFVLSIWNLFQQQQQQRFMFLLTRSRWRRHYRTRLLGLKFFILKKKNQFSSFLLVLAGILNHNRSDHSRVMLSGHEASESKSNVFFRNVGVSGSHQLNLSRVNFFPMNWIVLNRLNLAAHVTARSRETSDFVTGFPPACATTTFTRNDPKFRSKSFKINWIKFTLLLNEQNSCNWSTSIRRLLKFKNSASHLLQLRLTPKESILAEQLEAQDEEVLDFKEIDWLCDKPLLQPLWPLCCGVDTDSFCWNCPGSWPVNEDIFVQDICPASRQSHGFSRAPGFPSESHSGSNVSCSSWPVVKLDLWWTC